MSSKHHHHHKSTNDTKGMQFGRNVLAFFLFTTIFMLSFSTCLRAVVLNPNEFVKCFTDQDYVNSLFLDIQEYAHDACDEATIPYDSVDGVLNFDTVYAINEAYFGGNIGEFEQFTKTTYQDRIDEFNENLEANVNSMLKDNNITVDENQKANGVKTFCEKVTSYLKEKVEFVYISQLQTVANIGKVGLVVMIVVSAILTLILGLTVYSIGKKQYRGLRAVAYSFIASGMLNFVLVLGVQIVKMTKTLVIYPTYLCDAAMKYVNDCTNVFFGAGLASWIVAVIFMTVVWKLKRDEK